MTWLFGPRYSDPYRRVLQPRVLDIDVVLDVYRALATFHEADMQRPVGSEYPTPDGQPRSPEETPYLESARALRAPAVELVFTNTRELREYTKVVDIDHVHALNAYERSHILVHGAGVSAWFVRDRAPSVEVRMTAGEAVFPEDRLLQIAELIEGSGRRRVSLHRALPYAPFAIAFVGTVAGIWMATADRYGPAAIVFFTVVLAAIWVAALHAHHLLRDHYKNVQVGHRFREASRAAVRERMTNGRAAAIWAGITAIVTIPGTWLLTRLFGG